MPTTVDRPAQPALPLGVWLFAWVSLLNEVSAQMEAPLNLLLLASVLAAGPVASSTAWAMQPVAMRRLLVLMAGAAPARTPEAVIVRRGHEIGWGPVPLLQLWAWLAAVQSAVALWAAQQTGRRG